MPAYLESVQKRRLACVVLHPQSAPPRPGRLWYVDAYKSQNQNSRLLLRPDQRLQP
jgi:hypothetical protein